jgi:REP element-mobilizing transposase RayT
VKEYHERVVPHWHPTDRWLFITWRLAGTLPKRTNGPLWLMDPRVADVVANTILAGEPDLYNLAAWVIMPNHVHVILLPHVPMKKIMQKIKGSSAHQANKILNRTGAFWAIEYYDHWIRSEDELNRVIRYVERNPIKAGLTSLRPS